MYREILKKCGTCGGTGQVPVLEFTGTTAGTAVRYEFCPTCGGSGMKETDMFVEEFPCFEHNQWA